MRFLFCDVHCLLTSAMQNHRDMKVKSKECQKKDCQVNVRLCSVYVCIIFVIVIVKIFTERIVFSRSKKKIFPDPSLNREERGIAHQMLTTHTQLLQK